MHRITVSFHPDYCRAVVAFIYYCKKIGMFIAWRLLKILMAFCPTSLQLISAYVAFNTKLGKFFHSTKSDMLMPLKY